MSRKSQVLLAAIVSLLAVAGSTWLAARRPAAAMHSDGAATREVVDATGRHVRIPAAPRRILSLCTSATDTIVGLRQTDRLAAIDEFSAIVPGAEGVVVVGKGSAISREQVLAMKIDLAFVWWYQDDAADLLAGLSVPVVRIRSGRAADVPAMIRLVGECLGDPAAADELARPVESFLRDRAASTSDIPQRPRVYLELYSPFRTVGRDSYMHDLIELAGGANIAGDTTGSVLLSAERLIQADPDVILCVSGFAGPADFARRAGLAGLRAIRAGRVHGIERRWLIAGRTLPQGVAHLRQIIGDEPRQQEN